MKILFLSSEGLPYSKTGGLADVVQALPKALADMGHEVAVLLPRYRGNKNTSILVSSVTVTMGDQLRFPAISEGASVGGVRYFFVVDRGYFDREQLYGEKGVDYPDNAERFTEYCRTAIEFVKRVWLPDVIHCHDWQTALVPLLMRTQYGDDPVTRNLPVVLTIHNLAYQGMFPRAVLKTTGLPESLFTYDRLEFYGNVNFLKGGILFADYLSTVSRRYALEIQTPEYGSALDGVIRERVRQPGRDSERRRLRRVEPGDRYVHRPALFGAEPGRQESLQERPAAIFQIARGQARAYGASAGRHRFAISRTRRVST